MRERQAAGAWGQRDRSSSPSVSLPPSSPSWCVAVHRLFMASAPHPGGVAKSSTCWASLLGGRGPAMKDRGPAMKAALHQRTRFPEQQSSSAIQTPSNRIFNSAPTPGLGPGLGVMDAADAAVTRCSACRGTQQGCPRDHLRCPLLLSHGCFPSRIVWILSLRLEYVGEEIDLVRAEVSVDASSHCRLLSRK